MSLRRARLATVRAGVQDRLSRPFAYAYRAGCWFYGKSDDFLTPRSQA